MEKINYRFYIKIRVYLQEDTNRIFTALQKVLSTSAPSYAQFKDGQNTFVKEDKILTSLWSPSNGNDQ